MHRRYIRSRGEGITNQGGGAGRSVSATYRTAAGFEDPGSWGSRGRRYGGDDISGRKRAADRESLRVPQTEEVQLLDGGVFETRLRIYVQKSDQDVQRFLLFGLLVVTRARRIETHPQVFFTALRAREIDILLVPFLL